MDFPGQLIVPGKYSTGYVIHYTTQSKVGSFDFVFSRRLSSNRGPQVVLRHTYAMRRA